LGRKYDADGRRVAPLRVALPFQTVEMVNESAQDRQKALSLFESPSAYLAKEWRWQILDIQQVATVGSCQLIQFQFG